MIMKDYNVLFGIMNDSIREEDTVDFHKPDPRNYPLQQSNAQAQSHVTLCDPLCNKDAQAGTQRCMRHDFPRILADSNGFYAPRFPTDSHGF